MSDFRHRTFGPPRRQAAASAYPVIQWHHATPGQVGGFEIPTRHFAADLDLPFAVQEIQHGEGSEEAWLAPQLRLAIVGWRPLRWERRRGGITEVAPEGMARPWEEGFYSRRQIIAVVEELWDAGYQGFVVVSLKGTTSQAAGRALKAAVLFRQAAGRSNGSAVAYPEYAFWVPLGAGKSYRTEKGAAVTPLDCLLPEEPGEEDFQRLVIPIPVQEFIEAHLAEVEGWEKGGNGNGPVPAGRPVAVEDGPDEAAFGFDPDDPLHLRDTPDPWPDVAAPADEPEEEWLASAADSPRVRRPQQGARVGRAGVQEQAQAHRAQDREPAPVGPSPASGDGNVLPFAIKGSRRLYPRGTPVGELAGDRAALEQAIKVKKGRVAHVAADLIAQMQE